MIKKYFIKILKVKYFKILRLLINPDFHINLISSNYTYNIHVSSTNKAKLVFRLYKWPDVFYVTFIFSQAKLKHYAQSFSAVNTSIVT